MATDQLHTYVAEHVHRSPSYAAPEIVARREYLGPPVDVWSLGVVMFAMVAGYLPFHAKTKKVGGGI